MDNREQGLYNASHPKHLATDSNFSFCFLQIITEKVSIRVTSRRLWGTVFSSFRIFQTITVRANRNSEVILIAHALVLFMTLSVCFDLWQHRVPNKLLVAGYYVGLLGTLAYSGETVFFLRVALTAVVFLLLFPLYLCKGLGAGDVKLFMMMTVFLDYRDIVFVLVVSFLLGAGVGSIKMIVTRLWPGRAFLFWGTGGNQIHFTVPMLISIVCCYMRP